VIHALELTPNGSGLEQPGQACNRVLIAEDDALFRKILRSWLEAWGYQVTVADDGEKAWHILQEENAPHLLILDWIMPKMNGVDLCQLIRKRDKSPYQYILLATAKDDKHDRIRGLEAGADEYLSKPFDKDELHARLRTGSRILMLQDELLKSREEFRYQATHDGLTGTWNRRAIFDLLRREFDMTARSGMAIGLMMIDVDHFKEVNDTHGHLAGDAVLKEIARRIQEVLRSYDLVGRYGGEEFLIVLPDCDLDQVRTCAERIRRAMADEPVCLGDWSIPVTVSVGMVIANSLLATEKDALAAADTALYRAKNSGRNQVVSGGVHTSTLVPSS